MDRKQQPGMWFIFLVSLFLCTTAKTECSVARLGLKIKTYTKMLEGICDRCLDHALCSAPGTFSSRLWPARGQVGVVAKPGQAYLGCLKHLSSCPWPQSTAEEDGEQHVDSPGRGQGALQRKGGKDAEAGGGSVILGWFTQPRLVSDMHMHNLYISRTVISNTETNKSNVQIKIFFYF